MIDPALLTRLDTLPGPRALIAIAGAPGSGKSTFADALCASLNARAAGQAAVVPMDGYHLDNAVLDAHGWRARKGAPHTFDVDGLAQDLSRLRAAAGPVLVPVFDRTLDLARGAAREIAATCRVVLVEGNYLLLTTPPWDRLRPLFDLTIALHVPEAVLRDRLVQRWLDHGHTRPEAEARTFGNDLPNARLIQADSAPADITLCPDGGIQDQT